MEFYNLEKKSESTRGRKSLDMKHEMLLGGSQKQDKISALLQAVGSQSSPPRQPPIPQKFGNLLSPTMSMSNYMNNMSPFFNQLRPMMAPLGNNLLGPRFFTLGGMPNGLTAPPGQMLPVSLQQSLNMLNGQNLVTPMGLTNPKKEQISPSMPDSNGIKIPLKIPEVQSPPSYPPASASSQMPSAVKTEDVGLPQDLTTKRPDSRESLSPPRLSTGESLNLSSSRSTPVSKEPVRDEEPEDLSNPKLPPMVRESSPHEPLAAEVVPVVPEVRPPPQPTMVKTSPAHGHTAEETCNGCDCQHLLQLKTLRRNVFRMLSVFTPDLSRDDSINFETDEVDELLHEVIYSNIDDDCFKPKNDWMKSRAIWLVS